MNYIKKMCILRQVKQGFSDDGKALSGLVKIEQYGKNTAIEVSVINFAPLVSGEYYCVIADEFQRTEMLPLRGKSLFNILSDLDISKGFCAVICFVKNEISPIAYGINGNGEYDWKKILNATLPPSFFKKEETSEQHESAKAQDFSLEKDENNGNFYNDEFLATDNYFKEQENEQSAIPKDSENANLENSMEEKLQAKGDVFDKNEDAQKLLHPFTTDTDGYYLSVKREIDELFEKYPRDESLSGAFSYSEWVRLKGEKQTPLYLVGVVYDNGKARYICYALAAKKNDPPPKEIESVCSFVPCSPFQEEKGFFVIFQSAATGECIKPQKM
jgi:hypothetical protein